MPSVHIVVDSTADIPADARAAYHIHVVPVLLHRQGETLRDDIDISRDEYYRWIAEHDELPTTLLSAISWHVRGGVPQVDVRRQRSSVG